MSILGGVNVSKSFGAFDVFSGLNFSVARGDKIALVGPNGCGKTTLLRIIAGEDESDAGGRVHVARGVRCGYLAQSAEDSDERTVWQLAQSAFTELNALSARLSQIEHALAQADGSDERARHLLETYGALQHEFELKGGYEIEPKIKRVLFGLGFGEPDLHKPVAALSGGQRVRANLARLLLQSPDVLLLDEPTNHLDQQGVEWLESYLQEWEGTLIVVSHDRYFLDEVCDHVWEMGKRADGQAYLEFYRGGYTEYVQQRAERRERALAEYEAQREFIKKQEEYIRRNIAGQNTAQAKGRLRRLNRLERLEKPAQQRALSLRLHGGARSGDRVLETRALTVGYAATDDRSSSRALFSVPDVVLMRGERVALIGPNGVGKTTFLKTIVGELPPLAGAVKIGAGVRIGYFAQAGESLNPDHTVLEELLSVRADLKLSEARDLLGRFLFSGDDHFKRIAALSGGERGRVALAKLTLQGANFLLLDEPTNHLDIPAQEALTAALQQFDGTLLFVSHDRYLIAALATQLWILDRGAEGDVRMTVFKGAYDEWRDARDAQAPARPQGEKANGARSLPREAAPAAMSKNAQQQRQAKLTAIEQRIQALEAQLEALAAEMQQAGGDFARVQALGEAYRQAERELAAAWSEFEALA
ncbi:MAG: ABC-F family ATP-binding cassette domain-containing protein [Thermoflexales bacterium]|nr:ABC-F family ATP-binding cassette domain-containing protein [Thermoflexales bacterium]